MKKITTLFLFLSLVLSSTRASVGGTITTNPATIVANMPFVISYDGTGTNFTNWTPQCFIHVWLLPKAEMTFTGDYAPAWISCNSDADYLAIDTKYKMTHDGIANSGKYSISISNLYTYFNVLDEDKSKIDKFGIIVRAQYSGDNNQTNDFLLSVTNPSTELADVTEKYVLNTENEIITVNFNGTASIQLYTITGQLLHSATVSNQFTQNIKQGAYILKINGDVHKILVK